MEYFVVTNSFAAPFFSDTDERFVEAGSPQAAMAKVVSDYGHPAKLYAAALYENANAYHKKEKPLVKWLCNRARFMGDKSGSIYSRDSHNVEINGVNHYIADPYGGSVVE